MIRDRTDGRYNPVITVRSQAVQAVANASEQDRATDVFGIDTDLAASGVRIGCPPPMALPVCLESEPLNPSMPFLVWSGWPCIQISEA